MNKYLNISLELTNHNSSITSGSWNLRVIDTIQPHYMTFGLLMSITVKIQSFIRPILTLRHTYVILSHRKPFPRLCLEVSQFL